MSNLSPGPLISIVETLNSCFGQDYTPHPLPTLLTPPYNGPSNDPLLHHATHRYPLTVFTVDSHFYCILRTALRKKSSRYFIPERQLVKVVKMASTDGAPVVATTAQDAASNLHNTDYNESTSHHQPSSATVDPSQASSKAVEMTNLTSQPNSQGIPEPLSSSSTARNEIEDLGKARNVDTEDLSPASNSNKEKALSPATSKPGLEREYTVPAIGAATDQPAPKLEASDIEAATLMITLLLHTGARHPYKIDAKYLKKRNVNVTDNNPINMSVYTLKELIWRDWREGKATIRPLRSPYHIR